MGWFGRILVGARLRPDDGAARPAAVLQDEEREAEIVR
jgi:hypothetical protein